MTLAELFAQLEISPDRDLWSDILGRDVAGVTSDSRKVDVGFVFVGVPGSQVDGARFLPQAFSNGAVAAIISEDAELPAEIDPQVALVIRVVDPHLTLAQLAGRIYPCPLECVAAVTGTNGKTSIASFLRQIWAASGKCAANIGTIGIDGPSGTILGGLTTPDPVGLLHNARQLRDEGVTHLALEASSHGLDQKRLDGLKVDIGAFTNLTRDHLDYHGSFEAYGDAKAQLFSRLVRDGGVAVINLDDMYGSHYLKVAQVRGLNCLTVGARDDADLVIESVEVIGLHQRVHLSGIWGTCQCDVPLIGDFQASNALVAGLMAYASGLDAQQVIKGIGQLKGACGRMELVGKVGEDAAIYVDYSHTPDSLASALRALRPFTKGRLLVAFGAGGDRDPGKRIMMGEAAETHSDFAIVTDDNPRSEDPALIRAAVMEGVQDGIEIGGRAEAIRYGIEMMQPGDIFVVAGKGHERGQTVKGEVLPFSDHEAVHDVLAQMDQGVAI